jgi:hypothetical protein
MAGMDGGNGGWPLLYGANPVSAAGLKLAIDEDLLFDSERSHTAEQLAVLALDGTPSGDVAPYLRTGIVSGVSNSWTTVTLDHSYASMVVVATPNYDSASPPLVARVREVAGNSSQFQVKVDRADGLSSTVTGVKVHYIVVEVGVYTLAGGVQMEAVKFDGGCVLDVGSGEAVCTGLSMPHSPRWHQDRLSKKEDTHIPVPFPNPRENESTADAGKKISPAAHKTNVGVCNLAALRQDRPATRSLRQGSSGLSYPGLGSWAVTSARVDLFQTSVTPADVQRLRRALPDIDIRTRPSGF